MKKRFEIIGTVGTWTDSTTGKKVKRQLVLGAIYESTNGKLVLRIDAVPVSSNFSGWMQVKPCAPDLPPGRKVSPGMPTDPIEEQAGPDPDEDIPF